MMYLNSGATEIDPRRKCSSPSSNRKVWKIFINISGLQYYEESRLRRAVEVSLK